MIEVFLADDHAVVRDGLRSILESTGRVQIVGQASNGRSALDRIVDLKPTVAVVDIAMPELNGIEVVKRLNQTEQPVSTIILSMHATSEHIYRALEAGANGYLLKESAGEEVIDAVETVAGGERYLNQKITELLLENYVSQKGQLRSPLESLTDQEREVMQHVVEGKSSTQIGQLMELSPKTVETYRSRLMKKLSVGDLPELVRFAVENGLAK
jgi:DNA-binding NarL/FixJ family response regulator